MNTDKATLDTIDEVIERKETRKKRLEWQSEQVSYKFTAAYQEKIKGLELDLVILRAAKTIIEVELM